MNIMETKNDADKLLTDLEKSMQVKFKLHENHIRRLKDEVQTVGDKVKTVIPKTVTLQCKTVKKRSKFSQIFNSVTLTDGAGKLLEFSCDSEQDIDVGTFVRLATEQYPKPFAPDGWYMMPSSLEFEVKNGKIVEIIYPE